jgi:hypothetical protein
MANKIKGIYKSSYYTSISNAYHLYTREEANIIKRYIMSEVGLSEIELISEDPAFIKKFEKSGRISQVNLLDYLDS